MSDIEDLQIELENALDDIDELIAEIKRLRYHKTALLRVCGFLIGVVITYFGYRLVI